MKVFIGGSVREQIDNKYKEEAKKLADIIVKANCDVICCASKWGEVGIVYNELIARDYDVKVGNLENGEIDFIATRYNEKIYLQVAYILADDNVIEREFGVYKNIQDNYPKYVISTDTFDMSQYGIIHKNIIDWLLER